MLLLFALIGYVSAQTYLPGTFSGTVGDFCEVVLTARGGKGGNYTDSLVLGGSSGLVSARFSVSPGSSYRGVVATGGGYLAGGGSSAFLLNGQLLILGAGGGGAGAGDVGVGVGVDVAGGAGNDTGMGGSGSPNGINGINSGDGGSGGSGFGGPGGVNGSGGSSSGGSGGGGGIYGNGTGNTVYDGKMPNTDGSAAEGGICGDGFNGGSGYTSGGCSVGAGGGGGGLSGGGGGFGNDIFGGGGGGGNFINSSRLLFTTNGVYDGLDHDGSITVEWIPCQSPPPRNFVVSSDSISYNYSYSNTVNVTGTGNNITLKPNVTLESNITIVNNLTVTKSSRIVNNTIIYDIVIMNNGNTPIYNVTASDINPLFNKSNCVNPLPTNLTAGESSICTYTQIVT